MKSRAAGTLGIGCAAFLALLVIASPGISAAPQGPWVLPASDVSATGQDAAQPAVAISGDGTVTAVWERSDGTNEIIQAANRPPGGTFGTPVDISLPGQDADKPQIAVAPDGTATVVWTRSNGTHNIIQAATRPPGGAFEAPVDLSATGQNAFEPQVTVSGDGTATAVWYRSNGTHNIIQAATRPPGGAFGAPVDLSETGRSAFDPQIAVSGDGTAAAVWQRSNGSNQIVQAATRPPGGSFGAPVDLSEAGQNAGQHQISIDSDGTATAVWNRWSGSDWIVQSATRPPGDAFGAPVDLSDPGEGAFKPQVSFSSDGTATAVWWRSDAADQIIQAATRPPGGSFGAPVDLSNSGGDADSPQIAISSDGTATVVWTFVDGDSGASFVQSSTRPPAGSFGTLVDISADQSGFISFFEQRVAVSIDGSATAVWVRSGGLSSIVQAASTAQPSFPLQVARQGSGSGSVTSAPAGINCGSDCSEDFLSFTPVTLTAAPNAKSTFTGWSGGGCSGTGTCQITMLGDTSVTATFKGTKARLGPLRITPKSRTLRRGARVTFRIRVRNTGGTVARKVRVCGKAPRGLVGLSRCATRKKLASGATFTARVRVTVKPRARSRAKARVTFTATAKSVQRRVGRATVRIR